MREVSLLLGAAILVAGCSGVREPPTSADTQFSVVVYNRTQGPVFVLSHEVAACSSSRMPASATLVEGATPPPGVAQFPGAVKIQTPRGYTGTVSVVITAGASSAVTVGDMPASSLPACQGAGVAPVPSAPWWLSPPVYTPGQPSPACSLAAVYRVDGGAPAGLGYCAGLLTVPPVEVALRVGQVLDLHMASAPADGGPSAASAYPLPSGVGGALRAGPTADDGTTGAFVAVAPGTVDLMTTGPCDNTTTMAEADGPCPVIRVTVAPPG